MTTHAGDASAHTYDRDRPSTVSFRSRADTLDGFDRFADACLVIAARRWPDDMAEPMVREWRAELVALRAGRGLRSAGSATRFALSLALSRPVESERAAVVRERAQAARRQLTAGLAVVIVAIVTFAIDSAFLDFCVPVVFLLGRRPSTAGRARRLLAVLADVSKPARTCAAAFAVV